jgi:excisionase family DNA binding protein
MSIMAALLNQATPVTANEQEAALAKDAAARLSKVARKGKTVSITVKDGTNTSMPLPARTFDVLLRIVNAMAERRPFSVVPHDTEFTTQQAADYMSVSRPFLVGLIDKGRLEARLVGRHRRVRFSDLLAYEARSMATAKRALKTVVSEAQRLKLD